MDVLDKILTGNYLKFTVILIAILIGFGFWLWSKNKKVYNIVAISIVIMCFLVLFSNNIVPRRYIEHESLATYNESYTLDDNDKDFILRNYPYLARDKGSEIPTSHYEDQNYNVDDNQINYKSIDVRIFYYVHKLQASDEEDLYIYQFFSYFTTNGESIVEGSSHLHDFNRIQLYRYKNESTAFAIGFSTYNYDKNKHEMVYRKITDGIYSNDHPILLIDASTNEISSNDPDDPNKRLDNVYFSVRELNNYELVVVIICSSIALWGALQIYQKDKIHLWLFVIFISVTFVLYFTMRTGLVYHSDMSMVYFEEDCEPESDYWVGGNTYIDLYGGSPWMKSEWDSFTLSDKEDLNDLYISHKTTV